MLRQIGMVALTGKMARLERSHPSRTLNSFSFLVKRQRFGCEIYLLFIKKQILAPKKKKKRKQAFIWGYAISDCFVIFHNYVVYIQKLSNYNVGLVSF